MHRMLPHSAYWQQCPPGCDCRSYGWPLKFSCLTLIWVPFRASLVSSGVCMNYLCSSLCLDLSFLKAKGAVFRNSPMTKNPKANFCWSQVRFDKSQAIIWGRESCLASLRSHLIDDRWSTICKTSST